MRFCPEGFFRSDDVTRALIRQPAFLEVCHSPKAKTFLPVLKDLSPATRLIGVVGHVDGFDLSAWDTYSLLGFPTLLGCLSRGLDHMIQERYDAIGGLAHLETQLRQAYGSRFLEDQWVAMLAPRLAALRDRPMTLWDDGLTASTRKLANRLGVSLRPALQGA